MTLRRKDRWMWDAGLWVPKKPSVIRPRERALLPGFCVPGISAGFSGYADLTWRTNFSSSSPGSTVTHSSQPIGTANANRFVIVGVCCLGGDVNSVTVGGVAATLIVEADDAFSDAVIYAANVPSGTTADIVVSLTSPDAYVSGYWTVDMASLTAHDTATVTGTSPGTTIDVPDAGFIVAAAMIQSTTDRTGESGFSDGVDLQGDIEYPGGEFNACFGHREYVSAVSGQAVNTSWGSGSGSSQKPLAVASFNGNGT